MKDFKYKFWLYLIVFLLLVTLDQISKIIVMNEIGLGNEGKYLPGFIRVFVVQNTGGAFSLLNNFPIFFMIVGVITSFIFSYLVFCPIVVLNDVVRAGCLCILSGTVGNLIDRFINGAVIDFLDFEFINFAVFNFADVIIDLGVILILIGWYFEENFSRVCHSRESGNPGR